MSEIPPSLPDDTAMASMIAAAVIVMWNAFFIVIVYDSGKGLNLAGLGLGMASDKVGGLR